MKLLTTLFFAGVCLCETFNHLVSSLGSTPVLRVNDHNYKRVLANEDYSLVLFITASSARIGCVLCTEVMPTYQQMAASYYENLRTSKTLPLPDSDDLEVLNSRFVVAYADFSDSAHFFQELKVNSVPKIFFYPPGKAVDVTQSEDQYRFVGGETAHTFAEWIIGHSKKANAELFKIIEKPDYTPMLTSAAVLVAVSTLLWFKADLIFGRLFNRRVWRAVCMIICIVFCSGYMYNKIRAPPFTGKDRHGNPVYFAPSQQQQYAAETQIISIAYALACLGAVIVMDTVQKIKDHKVRLGAISFCVLLVYLVHAYLTACFRQKSGGYPFSFLSIF